MPTKEKPADIIVEAKSLLGLLESGFSVPEKEIERTLNALISNYTPKRTALEGTVIIPASGCSFLDLAIELTKKTVSAPVSRNLTDLRGVLKQKTGIHEKLIEILEKAHCPYEAAKCAKEQGMFSRAVNDYKKAGATDEAAGVILELYQYDAKCLEYDAKSVKIKAYVAMGLIDKGREVPLNDLLSILKSLVKEYNHAHYLEGVFQHERNRDSIDLAIRFAKNATLANALLNYLEEAKLWEFAAKQSERHGLLRRAQRDWGMAGNEKEWRRLRDILIARTTEYIRKNFGSDSNTSNP